MIPELTPMVFIGNLGMLMTLANHLGTQGYRVTTAALDTIPDQNLQDSTNPNSIVYKCTFMVCKIDEETKPTSGVLINGRQHGHNSGNVSGSDGIW